MSKESKLAEKPTRMPESRERGWAEPISAYLAAVETLRSESARSHRFAMLLQELLGLQPRFIESYVQGIERYLRSREKDQIVHGRADNLFGNVVIEFESDLASARADAEEQLRRYIALLWAQEPAERRTPYLCLATDGVRFIAYSPTLPPAASPDAARVRLQVLEECDWRLLTPTEVYYWLDRYLLRQEVLHPTSEAIMQDFGVRSHAFQSTTAALLALWQTIKTSGPFAVVFDSWDKYLHVVYGAQVAGDELFIRHTYLATLAKLMAWKRITESTTLPDDAQIVELLEGHSFKAQGIENFIEEDFFPGWRALKRLRQALPPRGGFSVCSRTTTCASSPRTS